MRSKKCISKNGFTLIEVLVVIGIIAILATVVLVAVNPARQFKLARDSQRVSNVNALLNAIHQNMSEHKGIFTCNNATKSFPTILTRVKSTGDSSYEGDISVCLVPDYLSSLPFDPLIEGAHYSGNQDYDTGYEFMIDPNGRLTVNATGEVEPVIAVTR